MSMSMEMDEKMRKIADRLLGASVGRVSDQQAGILPMRGSIVVSDQMMERALRAAPDLEPAKVRAILAAALEV